MAEVDDIRKAPAPGSWLFKSPISRRYRLRTWEDEGMLPTAAMTMEEAMEAKRNYEALHPRRRVEIVTEEK